MENSLFILRPYLLGSSWVFDDFDRGLFREPFVGGANTLLGLAHQEFVGGQPGFSLIFSASPFPGSQLTLKWLRADYGGNTYTPTDGPWAGGEAWLCPALLRYFSEPPKTIYVMLKGDSQE